MSLELSSACLSIFPIQEWEDPFPESRNNSKKKSTLMRILEGDKKNFAKQAMNHSRKLAVKWELEEDLYETHRHRIWPDFAPSDAPTGNSSATMPWALTGFGNWGFGGSVCLWCKLSYMATCWEISRLPIYCRHGDHRLKFSEQECEADVDLELEIKSRKRRCYFSLTQYRHRFVDGATVAAIQIWCSFHQSLTRAWDMNEKVLAHRWFDQKSQFWKKNCLK